MKMSLDIKLILESLAIFSPQDVDHFFRKYNLDTDETVIGLREKIDEYRQILEHHTRRDREYERVSTRMDSARDCLAAYETISDMTFAREMVHYMLTRGTNIEILHAYFTMLLRIRVKTKTAEKYMQLIHFAQIAAPELEKMNVALLRATDPLRQNLKQ